MSMRRRDRRVIPQTMQSVQEATDTGGLTKALWEWVTSPREQRRVADLAVRIDTEDLLCEEAIMAFKRGDSGTAKRLLWRLADLRVGDPAGH